MTCPTVGLRMPYRLFEQEGQELRRAVALAEEAGIDRLTTGDHVTFRGGQGFDGLLQSAVMAGLTSSLEVQTGVYLVGLRHPVPVARQVATVAQLAPGRFLFGVGVGGEDPDEWRRCGVDPSGRGRRVDETLDVIRPLLAGETVHHRGPFFDVDGARILPTPPRPVPLVVGGRSEAAVRRAALRGDGWLGLFVSARRVREVLEQIRRSAADAGRPDVDWWFGMHLWCSFDDDPSRLAAAMEDLYGIPFPRFAAYAPFGSPDRIASFLRPYLDAGCRHVNLAPVSDTVEASIDGVAEVARRLKEGA